MKKRFRGLSLIEIMIAMVVVTLSFGAFLTALRRSYQQAEQSRNRSMAIVLSRSLLDEVREHVYGSRAPSDWSRLQETPATIMVSSRAVDARFHKRIGFLNGSFVGDTAAIASDSDVVTITLSWHEEIGDSQTTAAAKKDGDNKQLVVSVPVWR